MSADGQHGQRQPHGDDAGGGGIFGDDYTSVTLTNSTVSGNSTTGADADGGGISAGGYQSDVTLTDSTVSGNSTTGATPRWRDLRLR